MGDGPPGAPRVRLRGVRRLLVHWSWEASPLKAFLPPALALDLFQGRAWVGLELSVAASVVPGGYSPLPGGFRQACAGVRTYVHDQFGRPGTWYLSLEVGGWIGVALCRLLYHLPAQRASITVPESSDPSHAQFRVRPGVRRPESVFGCRQCGPFGTLSPGEPPLDSFLIDRHRLFSSDTRTGILYSAEVGHAPYRVSQAELTVWDDLMLRDLRLDRSGRAPESIRWVEADEEQAFSPSPVPSADEETDLGDAAFGDSALPV